MKQHFMNESLLRGHKTSEYDSCGILAVLEKDAQPRHHNLLKTIDGLIKMEHRSGFINGEGDGCGVLTDIPRKLWKNKLAAIRREEIAEKNGFAVGHFFIPKSEVDSHEKWMSQIRKMLTSKGLEIVLEEEERVDASVLGKNGKADEPLFWQVALFSLEEDKTHLEAMLFEVIIEIEQTTPVHVASLSCFTAVYKVMGAANILPLYFDDLKSDNFETSIAIGHNRYSTNTASSFHRVQPFTVLGHNGEINTITKLKEEAKLLGVPIIEEGSDSQNLNRTVETFLHRYHLSLFEVMERIFPPILNEIKHYPDELKDLYMYFRETWGPFSQGPAAIVSRAMNQCVFSVDALGLRPLWMLESVDTYYFSSEQGIIPVHKMTAEPKPLAPGEKIGIDITASGMKVLQYPKLQRWVLDKTKDKWSITDYHNRLNIQHTKELQLKEPFSKVNPAHYAAFAWDRDQIQLVSQMAATGAEPIRSLGDDRPLAALARTLQNIPDFLKETVAVVTNPAIDREREIEHFSTRTVLGGRPPFRAQTFRKTLIELPSPILMEAELGLQAARQASTLSYEEVVASFGPYAYTIPLAYQSEEGIQKALKRIAEETIKAVLEKNAYLIVLDDELVTKEDVLWLDPHLAVSQVDRALKQQVVPNEEENLRRRTSILLRSGGLRNLHDIVTAIGLGANVIAPYLLFATAAEKGKVEAVYNLFSALNKGLEKVISTLGIHELRGYERLFSAIGLHPEIAEVLDIVNYFGTAMSGYNWEKMEQGNLERQKLMHSDNARPHAVFHFFPKLWKTIGSVANGEATYSEYAEKLEAHERTNPVSLRHLLDFNYEEAQKHRPVVPTDEVDISVGEHALPFAISSMSFGSQSEIAFRAYAEAAHRLNMVSLNGEGGEIKDMLGKYYDTRGHQVASGRFGVNIELANSAKILEIKIGQGAKPGEGGHLPGKKVSEKVAAARNATKGVDLISPSNNHDIYSIEDLAQVITELKTANSEAKVIVKVPVVPNIGTIAVGIAKAGADIITLSGFDGGTGAARVHALQYVGLPTEIGVKAAHNALIEAGLRDKVEIWSDGGIKGANDAVKMILMGANRVGFGTLSMIAIGCTACRACQLDTCHVGIATQIESEEEAVEKGLKHFVPQDYDTAVNQLVRFYDAMGKEMQRLTGLLGFRRAQDMVGRSDLLVQLCHLDRVDLSTLTRAVPYLPVYMTPPAEEAAVLVTAGNAEMELFAETEHAYHYSGVHSASRVLGSRYSGDRVKNRLNGTYRSLPEVNLHFLNSIPGNGLAAYNAEGINIRVQGGGQDGVGKTAFGGRVSIMKAMGENGQYLNGSVGKSFCYGAQKGTFIVQGNADSRAGIRLSGADIVIGGEVTEPVQDDLCSIAARANIKGFAFEYMTNGRALVLGDPGSWICSGMSGGVVYLRLVPEMGLTREALQRRIAKGAKVTLEELDEQGVQDVTELLHVYAEELEASGQDEKVKQIHRLMNQAAISFLRVVPEKVQADPNISTE